MKSLLTDSDMDRLIELFLRRESLPDFEKTELAVLDALCKMYNIIRRAA